MSSIPDFNNLFRLDGKVALITGGSRGIGLHIATAFLLAGARLVIITARKQSGIDSAVAALNALPGISGKATGIASSAADYAQIRELVRKVQGLEGVAGKLDILVANAGATWGSRFEDLPDEAAQKILDLNVRGVYNLARGFLPLLAAAGTPADPSRILIISSVAGITVPTSGPNGTIMYSVSKAAATHLGRNLAAELGPKNITTNVVAPGFFPSKLANGLIDLLGGTAELSRGNPRGRLGEPSDIAGVVVWLCSMAGAYVNGVDINIDGGARLVSGRQMKL